MGIIYSNRLGTQPVSTHIEHAPLCDVLLFADYFCDVIITGLSEPPRLGADLYGEAMEIAPGGAYILANGLHCLGVEVHWAARFGNDIFSRFILEESTRVGLNTSLFQIYPQPYRVFSLSFSFAHDRGFISFNDPAPAELPRHELILSQRPRWVVNPPFDGSDESRALMDLVHQQGGRVFVDCQYTTASLADPGLAETLRKVDIFAPNLSEASQLTGKRNHWLPWPNWRSFARWSFSNADRRVPTPGVVTRSGILPPWKWKWSILPAPATRSTRVSWPVCWQANPSKLACATATSAAVSPPPAVAALPLLLPSLNSTKSPPLSLFLPLPLGMSWGECFGCGLNHVFSQCSLCSNQ